MGEKCIFMLAEKMRSEREREETEERKALFSREKENGREKFPFTVAPDLSRSEAKPRSREMRAIRRFFIALKRRRDRCKICIVH